ncbi:MAG: DUF4955 domain-containing protein [Rikenellaceae bacterium]
MKWLHNWLVGVSLCCLVGCESDPVAEAGTNDSDSPDISESAIWQKFDSGSSDNLLIDYSYAGYKRGEESIPDVSTLGYSTFDITDYGAVANDGISDRAAFVAAAAAIKANGSGILYIPEGTFDIHTADDTSESIIITTSNLILKGESREKSILKMSAPMQPADPDVLYSSPVLIYLKHNSTISHVSDIVGDSPKGSFSVELSSAASISKSDWVCLKLEDNSEDLIAQSLGDYRSDLLGSEYDINTTGIQVWEYHQVKEVSGNIITFYEPLMNDVDSRWNWTINSYPHYSGVGVEDLTFEGSSKEDFIHHGTWEDDGAYKPINLMRLTNSWMRRVTFRNVSEASSIVNSANVSVYDISIEGNNGHSAIRAQCSSRVLLGAITDLTGGGVGQFHSTGVSYQSIGTVLWRCEWGSDSCFESHASQPRATLIDHCKGAFIEMRQGGDTKFLPSHMEDLTIWNLNATRVSTSENFKWWQTSSFKFLPPIIVGIHGAEVEFDSEQIKYQESNGKAVYPESLYEAQLKRRLGSTPAWMTELKTEL